MKSSFLGCGVHQYPKQPVDLLLSSTSLRERLKMNLKSTKIKSKCLQSKTYLKSAKINLKLETTKINLKWIKMKSKMDLNSKIYLRSTK